MKKLSECLKGIYIIQKVQEGCGWLCRQGLVAGAMISVIKKNKNYVVFYLDNFVCGIDTHSAAGILVKEVKHG